MIMFFFSLSPVKEKHVHMMAIKTMIADFNLSRKTLIFKAMENKQIMDEKVSVVKSLFKVKKVYSKKRETICTPKFRNSYF